MEVKQIYTLMNSVTDEILGKSDVIKEDLSNVVEVGTEIFGATDVDKYVKSLVNHIGKVVFVDRPYAGSAPSVLMDSWEFGSVMEKISADLPKATENESWELTDGEEYKQDIFYKPSVSAKFFNKMVTFEIPMSFTEKQVKQSFSSAAQLNGFLSMLYNSVEKSFTVKLDSLIMRNISNMIGETVADAFPTVATGGMNAYAGSTSIRAVNLLKLYNDATSADVRFDTAMQNPEFLRFCVYTIGLYIDRISKMSTLFNVGGKERFTSGEFMRFVLLSEFKNATTAYLQSDTFHEDLVKLPESEVVPYWQGSGQNYAFKDTSSVNVKTASGASVNICGVIGVIFDRDAIGVCNTDRRVTTNYNAKAEFFNNYYKFDAEYYNDLNENFVLFFIDEAVHTTGGGGTGQTGQ